MEIRYWSALNIKFNENNIENLKNKIEELNNSIFKIEFTNVKHIYDYEKEDAYTNMTISLHQKVEPFFEYESKEIDIDLFCSISKYDENKVEMFDKLNEILIYINSLSLDNSMNSFNAKIDASNKINDRFSTSITEYFVAHLIKGVNKNEINEVLEYCIELSISHNFVGLLSLQDACKKYNKAETTLKTNIKNGKFKEGVDVKKFGNTWVFNIEALEREYEKTL